MKKASPSEYILLIAVLVTIGFKFAPAFRNQDSKQIDLRGDYVEPNYHAPHPTAFPYVDR